MDGDHGIVLLLFRVMMSQQLGQSQALAVSGGVKHFQDARAAWPWHCEPSGDRSFPSPSPFLHHAEPWVIAEMLWSLIEPNGRLYVMFTDDADCASAYGLTVAARGWARYTLSLRSPVEAALPRLWTTFFDNMSEGLAVGFSGPDSTTETRLSETPAVYPIEMDPRKNGPDWPKIHKDLFERAPAVAADTDTPTMLCQPWGYEDNDGLLVSDRFTSDEMVNRIRNRLGDRVHIIEAGDGRAYEQWVATGELRK